MTPGLGLLLAAALANGPAIDFGLPGDGGTPFRLSQSQPSRVRVIVFLSVECPLANRYAPRLREIASRFTPKGVSFLAIDANRHDDASDLAAFAREHQFPFPCLMDHDGEAVAALNAARTPEVFVLDEQRHVRYRGRIDDQYEAGGKAKPQPEREDLVEAVRDVLARRAVRVPRTAVTGCLIARPKPKLSVESPVTFSRDVAPILLEHCAVCHHPGDAAPFSLLSFEDARKHAETIAEVVAEGRMPPWHAASEHGQFRNGRGLTAEQKRLIEVWVKQGTPQGNPSEQPPLPVYSKGWAIGTPDVVYPIPSDFSIPATGVIEYQHFLVDPRLAGDVWVRAAEIRPGNRRVVHHCSVFLQPPDSTNEKDVFEIGALGSANLIAWTPGSGPTTFPAGMAKRIPAGWKLHFIVHYTPIGTPQTDRTELALSYTNVAAVKQEVATKLLMDLDLAIPPHAENHRVEKTWQTEHDMLLLAMLPHMHLRGRSFRYDAEYPDGSRETLLEVPAYDFNWQHRYELAEPKRLPAGTIIRCTAVYDNSSANRFNPDPGATVKAGEQSWDEMFNGYLDIALADQDIAAEIAASERSGRRKNVILGTAVIGLLGLGLRVRRRSPRDPGTKVALLQE